MSKFLKTFLFNKQESRYLLETPKASREMTSKAHG